NRSHWSTSKTPSYTKSVSWQHHPGWLADGINPGRERAGRDNNVTVNHQTNIKAAGIGGVRTLR
ncbi:hypothetical protein, partial [Citrobacter freundii]|uniref:hypothetical protein n=3 Tax=Enterobacterales TaxID=91347 RepID=UPI001BA6A1A0